MNDSTLFVIFGFILFVIASIAVITHSKKVSEYNNKVIHNKKCVKTDMIYKEQRTGKLHIIMDCKEKK